MGLSGKYRQRTLVRLQFNTVCWLLLVEYWHFAILYFVSASSFVDWASKRLKRYEEWHRRKNSYQQPLPGSLGKTGRAKAGVNIPLSQ